MTAGCSCRSIVAATQHLAHLRERYFGIDGIDALKVVAVNDRTATVLVTYHYTRSGIETADGRVLSESSGRTGVHEQLLLLKGHGGWKVASISLVDRGDAR